MRRPRLSIASGCAIWLGRYGAFSNLLGWQFFNEINNLYGEAGATREANRERNRLHPPDVVAWHDAQSKYLKGIDLFGHLITTSFGSAGEQKEMWKLPNLDYMQWHWYGNWGGGYSSVLSMTDGVAQSFRRDYNKPVYVGEFGTDGRSFAPEGDPGFRGLRAAFEERVVLREA
jgi:hypothetical protein